MTSQSSITHRASAEKRTQHLVELWSQQSLTTQEETLARLLSISLCQEPQSPLHQFAMTGRLDPEAALSELNDVEVPLEREDWVDTLGRFILSYGDRS